MPESYDLATGRGRRRLIIEMSRRRQRPGSGSNLRALMERGPTMDWPDLRGALDPLPWAVIGAVATRLYMPERMAASLDLLVAAGDLDAAQRRLTSAGWQHLGSLTVGGSTWRSPEGVPLGLLGCGEPWCHQALSEARDNRDAKGLPIAPLPHLVLLKLAAGRTQDVADVTRMLGLADDGVLARVRLAVREHSPQDLEDVDALIELGKLETEGR